ncbi:MAG: HD domain-containing protein [Selenomonadaceae bacterium]|nr:HD domain-containing protein [Selenomonadaceae bacterium]
MRELLARMHEWMSRYMKSFYSDDAQVQQGILIKEKHTGYVTANCVELAKFLKLSTHDTHLAEIIGLFHDVGRFRQYSIYKTFNDADSEDHADLALKVIDELDFFKELTASDYDLVKFAIQNHNKKTIAPTDDERKLLFAKLIRDADKLDIYRVLEPFLAQENVDKMPQFIKSRGNLVAEISPDFVENFVTGEQADYTKIRTNGDRKIVRLMWIYDVNFSWTMKKIVERGYIEKIVSNLPPDERVAEGVRRLRLHVEEKLSEVM